MIEDALGVDIFLQIQSAALVSRNIFAAVCRGFAVSEGQGSESRYLDEVKSAFIVLTSASLLGGSQLVQPCLMAEAGNGDSLIFKLFTRVVYLKNCACVRVCVCVRNRTESCCQIRD